MKNTALKLKKVTPLKIADIVAEAMKQVYDADYSAHGHFESIAKVEVIPGKVDLAIRRHHGCFNVIVNLRSLPENRIIATCQHLSELAKTTHDTLSPFAVSKLIRSGIKSVSAELDALADALVEVSNLTPGGSASA